MDFSILRFYSSISFYKLKIDFRQFWKIDFFRISLKNQITKSKNYSKNWIWLQNWNWNWKLIFFPISAINQITKTKKETKKNSKLPLPRPDFCITYLPIYSLDLTKCNVFLTDFWLHQFQNFPKILVPYTNPGACWFLLKYDNSAFLYLIIIFPF